MNPNFSELLRAFTAAEVRYMVVGAYALGLHGRPRATGDLDVWIEASRENATRVMHALAAFGAPLAGIAEAGPARAIQKAVTGTPITSANAISVLRGKSHGALSARWNDGRMAG